MATTTISSIDHKVEESYPIIKRLKCMFPVKIQCLVLEGRVNVAWPGVEIN